MIDCEALAAELRAEIADYLSTTTLKPPTLVAVQVGEDPASTIYVRNKIRSCDSVGIRSRHLHLPASVTEGELLREIAVLNSDRQVDGILLQLPLPSHLNSLQILKSIDPTKDVDGLNPINLGLLLCGERSGFAPCTPLGIHHIAIQGGIHLPGSHVVIAGRSNIVGKPLAALLMQKSPRADATVTLVHSHTRDLAAHTRRADLLVAAIGSPLFFTAEMVRPGAAVIDVGINRIEDPTRPSGRRLVGDVDFEAVAPLCSKITRVPKGVGLMTIAMLLRNTLIAFQRNRGVEAWEW